MHLTPVFKNITFETIDWAVYNYFDKKFPLVVDGRKVPVVFASPERWAQVQRDNYLKDSKGQLMLPAIAIRRGNPEVNVNRYVPKRPETDVRVRVPVLTPEGKQKFYTDSNSNKIAMYEIHRMSYPRFIMMNYIVIIWASYYVDINEIQQRYLWEGADHVFTYDGLWFSGTINGINEGSNTEDNTKQERIQKVEYNVNINGYISDIRSFKKDPAVAELIISTETIDDKRDFHFSEPLNDIPVR